MAVPVALPGASGACSVFGSSGGRLMGFSVRETAGATGSFRLRVGSATGTIVETISLTANQSTGDWYGPQGVYVSGDIYYEKLSGTIEGSVWGE